MEHYAVKGMSCAACVARVEKAVKQVDGVTDVTVSLLTNSMAVEGSARPEDVVKAVKQAGYGAKIDKHAESSGGPRKNAEFRRLLVRFLLSLAVLLVLMYISMGHMMFRWPLPGFMGSHVVMCLVQAVLSLVILIINGKFFVNGFKGLLHGAPNMDTLVALGSGVSFVYSLVLTVRLLFTEGAEMPELYFESAAMILVLITLGKMLEAYSKGKTTSALDALKDLAPATATVVRDGMEQTVPVGDLVIGDVFLVRPGESIPADGTVLEGTSGVNEASLTGESIPVDKSEGDEVSQGTINENGYLKCQVTRIGDETMLSKIIRLVSDASATKAPAQRLADRIAGIFVPVVMGISLVTFAVWMIVTKDLSSALTHAITVLVVSCPCALGLATPVAIMVGSGVGAKNGILFKTAAALEALGKVGTVVMDKTGTVTKGEPEVTDVFLSPGASEERLLTIASALEQRSEHPLAKAVMKYAGEGTKPLVVNAFRAVTGSGLTGEIEMDGKTVPVSGGKLSFVQSTASIPGETRETAERLQQEGKTVLVFSAGGEVVGGFGVLDTLKPDAKEAVEEIRTLHMTPVLLSGDHETTARTVGTEAGFTEIVAGVMPDEKEAKIRELKQNGRTVAMVGDGINDAPALTSSDVGLAIGAGTDVAIDAADVVLVKNDVYDVAKAIRLSRATYRNIKENLFWAFFYNLLMIPLAAGVFTPITGWTMNPMIGAAAMSLSSVTVVLNALRLNLVKLDRRKRPE